MQYNQCIIMSAGEVQLLHRLHSLLFLSFSSCSTRCVHSLSFLKTIMRVSSDCTSYYSAGVIVFAPAFSFFFFLSFQSNSSSHSHTWITRKVPQVRERIVTNWRSLYSKVHNLQCVLSTVALRLLHNILYSVHSHKKMSYGTLILMNIFCVSNTLQECGQQCVEQQQQVALEACSHSRGNVCNTAVDKCSLTWRSRKNIIFQKQHSCWALSVCNLSSNHLRMLLLQLRSCRK